MCTWQVDSRTHVAWVHPDELLAQWDTSWADVIQDPQLT